MGLRMVLIELAALGATYQVIAIVRDKQAFPALGQLVNMGGYKIHL
jgi:hypothetical protein